MIAIYYIATGTYVGFFDGFINSVERWMPNEEKCVVLLGDSQLAAHDGYHKGNVSVEYHAISHYPWPTIALWKFWMMGQHKKEGARLHFYFNANIEFTEECETFDFSCFDCGKVVVTQHSESNQDDFGWLQTGSICIPDVMFDAVIAEHTRRTCEYLQRDYRVPEWHDETVMNEMLIRDRMFSYEFFDSANLRWHFTDTSKPNKGLCYLRPCSEKNNTKNMYR